MSCRPTPCCSERVARYPALLAAAGSPRWSRGPPPLSPFPFTHTRERAAVESSGGRIANPWRWSRSSTLRASRTIILKYTRPAVVLQAVERISLLNIYYGIIISPRRSDYFCDESTQVWVSGFRLTCVVWQPVTPSVTILSTTKELTVFQMSVSILSIPPSLTALSCKNKSSFQSFWRFFFATCSPRIIFGIGLENLPSKISKVLFQWPEIFFFSRGEETNLNLHSCWTAEDGRSCSTRQGRWTYTVTHR